MNEPVPFIVNRSMNYNQYGFEYIGSCNCDGIQTEKYRNGVWQLKHRAKTGLFRFKKDGRTVTTWMDQSRAENYIKENIHVAA